MSFLYRFAVTITRKQGYIDWANSFGDDVTLTPEIAGDNRTIYLVPETSDEPDRARIIDEYWELIFEQELGAWVPSDDRWPQPRTREMFDAWFEAEITASVLDLAPDEPLTQAEVESIDLDTAVHRCAWCDIEVDEGAGQFVGFKLASRDRLAHREGLTVLVSLSDDQVAVGVMTRADSDAARGGEDLLFRACTSACERALRSAVPKALRKLFRS